MFMTLFCTVVKLLVWLAIKFGLNSGAFGLGGLLCLGVLGVIAEADLLLSLDTNWLDWLSVFTSWYG